MPRTRASYLTLILLPLLVGCADNVIGPDNQLEVTNATDSFQWQATGLDDVSQTLTYTWKNTGTIANINQSASVTGGTATLFLRDAAGNEVYRRALAENGTFESAPGPAGDWTIYVFFSDAKGTVNFRVEKP